MKDNDQSRRDFFKKASALGVAGLGLSAMASGLDKVAAWGEDNNGLDATKKETFILPALAYAFDALEPHIDKMTMEIHHDKHHQAYVNNLNKACEEGHIDGSLEDLVKNASKYPSAVRNNAGGHWNHSFFWENMAPGKGGVPPGKVAEALNATFGDFETFKKQLNEAAMKRFGSGWAWLVKTPEGKLTIGSTPNQDNPLMDLAELKGKPLLGVDVWEHAYYLKYQNKRADYLTAWWNVVNWDAVAGKM
jgi:Fe-Mn family superoxide dismutase